MAEIRKPVGELYIINRLLSMSVIAAHAPLQYQSKLAKSTVLCCIFIRNICISKHYARSFVDGLAHRIKV